MPSGERDERLFRIYGAVARRDDRPGSQHRIEAICNTCVDVLPVTGAGIMLMAERAHQGTLYATDERILQLEDLQNAAAEGPCLDSYNLGRPVFAPDLSLDGHTWPLLSRSALGVGICALFSFPLQLDDTAVGALDLYRDEPGRLNPEQIADARLLAAMATREVLALHSESPVGSLTERVADLSGDRTAIEQATGMVAAQIDGTVVEAGRRLRAFAAEVDRPLPELAYEVVGRTIRFT